MHKMTESSQRSRMPGDREMVFMMAMVMALNALAIDSMLPALPAIGEGLGVAVANDRQYVISTYLFGIGAGSLLHGPLSDRFGRKPVLLAGIVCYVAGSLACAAAWPGGNTPPPARFPVRRCRRSLDHSSRGTPTRRGSTG